MLDGLLEPPELALPEPMLPGTALELLLDLSGLALGAPGAVLELLLDLSGFVVESPGTTTVLELLEAPGLALGAPGAVVAPLLEVPGRVASLDFGLLSQAATASAIATAAATRVR